MNKQNWTYKKLGEVGSVIGGSTPKTDVPEFWNGEFAWITPAELDGSKYVSSTIRTITEKAVSKTNLTLLPVGTVLLSSRAPIGKVCITKIPMYCNQGFKNIVCSDELNNEFLYWWLKGKSDFLNSLGVGATFKEISKRMVEQIVVPVPPLATQSRIVSELDLLQSLIDKQKAQLKEYDTLAQSIFYDMFGDPVENEKGWEVNRLGDLCDVTSSKRIFAEEYVERGVPFYRSKEVIERSKGLPISVELFISEERYRDVKDKFGVPVVGDILVTAVGTIGKIWTVNIKDPFYFKDGNVVWLRKINKEMVDSDYFRASLILLVEEYKKVNANGAAYNALTIAKLKDMQCVLPPLSLQQTFATKIELIEKQKTAISKSIAETQKLFDYTMDKYFG